MVVKFAVSARGQISANITRYAIAHKMTFSKRPTLSFEDNRRVEVTFSMVDPQHENKILIYLSNRADFLGFIR